MCNKDDVALSKENISIPKIKLVNPQGAPTTCPPRWGPKTVKQNQTEQRSTTYLKNLSHKGKNQKPWRKESHVSRNYQKANDGPPFDLTLSLSLLRYFSRFSRLWFNPPNIPKPRFYLFISFQIFWFSR